MDGSRKSANDNNGDGDREINVDGGGDSHPSHRTGTESIFHIASNICQAAERDDTSSINSLLKDYYPIHDFIEMFHKLIGYYTTQHIDNCIAGCDDNIPLSVKAHLMLRAFLQFPHNTIPWDAATSAIKSLQYSISNQTTEHHHGKKSSLSHGEELAMVSELRSYITNLRTVQYNNHKNAADDITSPIFVIHRLIDLGDAILAPLRLDSSLDSNDGWGGDNVNEPSSECETNNKIIGKKRRHDSYLLPLELIPTILASIDELYDVRVTHSLEDDGKQSTIAVDPSSSENTNIDEGEMMHIPSSDDVLSSMFASYVIDNDICNGMKKFVRALRADALLPLLSLAIDDIGFGRMSMVLPRDDRATYWDCLKFALNDAIHANLICYSDEDTSSDEATNVSRQRIVEEASHDEGVHIIPISDYPALMRCVFRMIDISISSSHSTLGLSWESLFLRLYHAAAVATTRTPLGSGDRRQKPRDADRSTLISTIESHVLLPSYTGASVSTITSILEACSQDCCIRCTRDASDGHKLSSAVPAWAIAGVVLVIMRARSSIISHSATSTNFGPRVVFRMASNLLLKRTQETKIKLDSGGGGDDVGCALKVLLRLSTVKEYACLDCRGDNYGEDAEKHAYDVLNHTYYGGHDIFFHRHKRPDNSNNSYQYDLGLHTLSSISNLVRSSLNRGVHATERNQSSQESFLVDTAKTWIDAANMLLDESLHSPTHGTATSSIQDGTALAVVIIVVVFFEVPASQDAIVRSIYDRLANMTLYTSNGVGRKGGRSVFLLISILAWSLVSTDLKYSCSDALHTRGGKQLDHATTILDPFCNLLSKAALSRDQYLHEGNNEAPRLSYWALRMLARALLPVSSGREVVLAMAQKNMRGLSTASAYLRHTSNNIQFFESLPCNPSSSNDALYFALDCLCALTERCHPSNDSRTDDCGRAALGMLSDLIILQQMSPSSKSYETSRVPIDCVLWTIGELTKCSRLQKLSGWISQRLLQVCYMGLLKFILVQESEVEAHSATFVTEIIFPNSSSMPKAGQYISGLLQLAVCLYDESAIFHAVPNSSVLLYRPILRALRSARHVSEPVSGNATNQNEIDQHLREGHYAFLKGFNASDVSRGCDVDSVTLVILFQAAAQMVRGIRPSPPGRADNDLIQRLNEYIISAERFHFLREDKVHHRVSPLPAWINDPLSSIDGDNNRHRQSNGQMDEAQFDSVEFKCFLMSLCDILAEILLQNRAQCNPSGVDIDHDLSELHGMNTVLGCKRRVSSTKGLLLNNLQMTSVCGLLDLSAQIVRPLLSTSENRCGALSELETLVLNVLDVSKIDPISIQGQTSHHQILSSFSSLYGSLCDEESSRLLISFVKESYVEMGKWADPAEASFSLLSITSSEDLDYHVRAIRETIITSLTRVLSLSASDPDVSSIDERKANIDVVFQLLLQLCQDLDASFQGYSGGIQKKLLLVFLDAIDKCIDVIAALFESMPASTQCEMKRSFESVHQASAIIWEIFCDNALRQAAVIKATLRLCIDKIPNMLLRVERIVEEFILNEPPSEFVCELLDKCCAQLLNKPVLPVGDVTPENTIRSDEMDIMTVSNEDGGNSNERSDSPETKRARIPNIATSAMLAWFYNCAFVSMTNIWNASYQIIAGGTKLRHMEKSTSLARRRVAFFSRMLTSMCRLFEEQFEFAEVTTADTDVDSAKSPKLVVELLSFHGKSNMCNCAEKISITMVHALRQIIKYFRVSTYLTIDGRESLKECRLHESLICVLGWLRSVKAQETKYYVLTGFLQWQANEKSSFSISSLGRSDGYPILSRLPKVLLRLEGLDAELRKLEILLSTRNDKCSSSKRQALDQVMTALMGKGQEADEPANFLKLLQECIKIVDDSKNTLQLDDYGNIQSEEEDSDADIDEDDFILSGKRQNQHPYGKVRKSRRVSLRSRNDTIDNWLTMDDDEFGAAPGEKYNADDAFVDLEDFIVEG